MIQVRCPFCLWSRMADTSKGAQPFDVDATTLELLAHLDDAHYEAFYGFLQQAIAWRQSQMVAGNFPRITDPPEPMSTDELEALAAQWSAQMGKMIGVLAGTVAPSDMPSCGRSSASSTKRSTGFCNRLSRGGNRRW